MDAYENPDYDRYVFDSHMIFKLDEVEPVPYVVYVRKDIQSSAHNV